MTLFFSAAQKAAFRKFVLQAFRQQNVRNVATEKNPKSLLEIMKCTLAELNGTGNTRAKFYFKIPSDCKENDKKF